MPEHISANNNNEIRLLSEVLNLYYVQELTQAEVGRRLGLSTTKVNRLLQQARRQGMVEVTIRVPFQHLFDLEARLQAIFGVEEAVVIPGIARDSVPTSEDPDAMVHTLGRVGADCLLRHLRDGDVLAVGGGTAVYAVALALEPARTYDVAVVPTSGGVQGLAYVDVNYLASEIAERLGGRAYQLHAPAFVETREQRDMLLSMGPVKGILDIARQANVALMGVGTVDDETSRYVKFTALLPEDMQQIAEFHGGVGEIAAFVFDIEGRPCAQEYAERVVGLGLSELRRIPVVVGVAATSAKALPLYGALRGDYLDALVTDEVAAQGVLRLFERDFRGETAGRRAAGVRGTD
jgi:DNA-binding transcriptional regulator LsrR (DeoR family)